MAAQNEAAEPTMSPLSHLTSQSAAFGLWEVLIFAPDAQECEYIYQKQKRTAYNFRCLLVSTQDPTAYVLGESRGKGMSAQVLKDMSKRFKQGLAFRMKKKPCLQCEATAQQRSEERSRLYVAHDLGTSPE